MTQNFTQMTVKLYNSNDYKSYYSNLFYKCLIQMTVNIVIEMMPKSAIQICLWCTD